MGCDSARSELLHCTVEPVRHRAESTGAEESSRLFCQGVDMNRLREAGARLACGLAMAGLAGVITACGGGGGGAGSVTDMPPPSAVYAATNLVSDGAAVPAAHTDTHLVNGWGVAFNPQGYAWVANNG